jgi:hypothetical protein
VPLLPTTDPILVCREEGTKRTFHLPRFFLSVQIGLRMQDLKRKIFKC